MSCRLPSLVVVHFLDLAPRPLSTEQPESTPRVSYLTTQVSTDCRIDFAVVCRVVLKCSLVACESSWVSEPSL